MSKVKEVLKKTDWRVATVGIISVTILESIALINGIDGALLTLAFVAVAGLAGFELKKHL